jgi:dimethylhistidine N-methyltransferase
MTANRFADDAVTELAAIDHDTQREVLTGLSRRPRRLPCKLFYDPRGAALFEQICQTPEYYLTRTELAIMRRRIHAMAAAVGPHARLVEFGSGASVKVRLLLDSLPSPAAYVPIDISVEQLDAAAQAIAQDYPRLSVTPVFADYTRDFELPPPPEGAVGKTVVFFPGSTIGNFPLPEAVAFLRRIAAVAGPGGGLLIGVDLVKDPAIIERAYNDAQGVTAAFNLNILEVLNRQFGADFDPSLFEHEAEYDHVNQRVEMRLRSRVKHRVTVAGRTFTFEPGEAIVTEHSHKHTPAGFAAMAAQAGLAVRQVWCDPARVFSVQYLDVRLRS